MDLRKLFETTYTRPDVDLDGKIEAAFESLPDDWENYPTIELLDSIQEKIPGWTFSLVDDSGQWKYGNAEIKQSWLDGRGWIHVEVSNDFVESNKSNLRELKRAMRAILAHEDTHRQQYELDPGMYVDEDNYYEDEHEVDAHAREAAQELLDLGVTSLTSETYANSDTAFRYWEDFGRYAEEDESCGKIWDRFYSELRDYFEG